MLQRGIERERECIDSLTSVTNTGWDGKDFQSGFDKTLRLMKEGHPWISGAVLLTKTALGFPDLLKGVDGNSRIGGHTYVPVDIKQDQLDVTPRRIPPLVLGSRTIH